MRVYHIISIYMITKKPKRAQVYLFKVHTLLYVIEQKAGNLHLNVKCIY